MKADEGQEEFEEVQSDIRRREDDVSIGLPFVAVCRMYFLFTSFRNFAP